MQDILNTISLGMGASWASGINLYATLLMLGFLNSTGNIVLPENLEVLSNPIVMGASAIMYVIEFFMDKIPGVDTAWDTIHSFIRIPAGAVIAASALGDMTPAAQVAGAIIGGGVTAATHATKAGGRVIINTSPEPVTNWIASIGEDVAVLFGLYTALHHPLLFLCFLALFIVLLCLLLPKIFRGIQKVLTSIGRFLGLYKKESSIPPAPHSKRKDAGSEISENLSTLERLKTQGQIGDSEYKDLREKILGKLTRKD